MTRPTGYFIRDDDVGELTDALKFFVELFVSRAIPVSYQVIPAQLTDECAAYMLGRWRAHPGLIEFGQHGLHHHMEVGGERVNREFGPERPAQEQAAVIAEGARILRERLGADAPVRVFTPPQHKFDRNTVLAAAAVGHRAFSAAYYPEPKYQLAYLGGRLLGKSSFGSDGVSYHGRRRPEADILERSIAIKVDDGATVYQSEGSLGAAVAKAARRTDAVGFMFHHYVYADPASQRQLTGIVDRLAAFGPERFSLLGAGA